MKNIKILVVDDQLMIRKILSRSLVAAGFKVAAAEDGLNALEILKENTFDVMITDIMMPKMDGISLLLETRKVYPEMPVLIITGFAKELSIPKARQLGAVDLLYKPFKNTEVVMAVQKALATKHQVIGEKSQS